MARLIFPADLAGLKADVFVALDGDEMNKLILRGQPLPPPLRARGVIDTGSNVTVVSRDILLRLGVAVALQSATHTVSGSLPVDLYRISIGVTDFADPTAPTLIESSLLVMELADSGRRRHRRPRRAAPM